MIERALDDPGTARAFLRICGTTVARQQLSIALSLNCKRIICIAPALSRELVELQHLAEGEGARFHVVASHRALAGIVTATDDVFAFADGLLMTSGAGTVALEQASGVLVQPIEPGLTGGFERIDLNTAAAGAMRVPGRLVSQLNDLPTDCDAYSSLQRIALQAGLAKLSLPAAVSEREFWMLVTTDAVAHEIEPQWIRARIGDQQAVRTPGRWIAVQAVRMFGPAILDSRSGLIAILAGAVVIGLLGLFAGWYGFATLGLGLAGLAWIGLVFHDLLRQVELDSARQGGIAATASVVTMWLLDGLFVVLAAWGAQVPPDQADLDRFFPPLMLMLVLRLVTAVTVGRQTAWLSDRLVLCCIMITAIATGFGEAFLHGGAVLLTVVGLFAARAFKRIT